MKRTAIVYLVVGLFLVTIASGCSTTPKKVTEEVQGIKARVDTLESRVEGVESKQAESERASFTQFKTLEEMETERGSHAKTNISIRAGTPGKDKESIKQIQLCLKNAGFYKGSIDGVKGKKTKVAVKKFQREHGLTADGVVGKKTWEALSQYAQGQTQSMQEGTTK